MDTKTKGIVATIAVSCIMRLPGFVYLFVRGVDCQRKWERFNDIKACHQQLAFVLIVFR